MPGLPRLSVEQILAWADEHHARTGRWPHYYSGVVRAAPRETWTKLSQALREGRRGLPARLTLARLLAKYRGKPSRPARGPLSAGCILAWADAHRLRTGAWPSVHSGPVSGAPGENWRAINDALREGRRGLPRGDSLAALLDRERGLQRRSWRA